MKTAVSNQTGFTLIELMVVVAIVGVLAAAAVVSYRHFTGKAQSVEAEVALTEIQRLQQMHQAQHGSYGDDLSAIGFSPIPPLKFYSVGLRFFGGIDGVSYQAYAYAKGPAEGSTTFVLTQYQDGHVAMDKSLVAGGAGTSGAGGNSPGSLPGSGGSPSAQTTEGGALGDDPLAGSGSNSGSAFSSGGQRTVTHVNQSVGMGSP